MVVAKAHCALSARTIPIFRPLDKGGNAFFSKKFAFRASSAEFDNGKQPKNAPPRDFSPNAETRGAPRRSVVK